MVSSGLRSLNNIDCANRSYIYITQWTEQGGSTSPVWVLERVGLVGWAAADGPGCRGRGA